MSSQVSHDAFRTIFPKYSELLSEGSLPGNESIQTFLRQQLPRKVELVRNMESSFNAFLTHFTTVILKRPQHAHLLHSLTLKAGDKIEKYFQQLSNMAHKIDPSELRERLTRIDLQALKKEFRAKMESVQSLLKDKYFGGSIIERQCEEEIAMRLYVLLEIYHFLKGDPVTIAGKLRLRQQDVLWTVSKNQQPNDISELVSLDPTFISFVEETVQKRCRPFCNKRDLLESKVRQVLREGESRVSPNLNLLIESLISKERVRISRELSNALARQLRDIPQCQGESEAKEMGGEVQVLKREFAQLKNTTYFLDIMRGSFSEKYKMEVNRLENVFYLTNLQKFLQDVSTFLEKVLALEERVIRNRKDYMRDFGNSIQIKISDLVDSYSKKPQSHTLTEVIQIQFEMLESALYGIVSKPAVRNEVSNFQREDREAKEAEIRKQAEMKAKEERDRREAERAKLEEKRRKDEERLQQARQERQEKQRRRKEENQRAEMERRAELQRKRQQKARKDEELRRQREIQLSKKEQQEKMKREQQKKRQEQQDKKKQQELKRKQEEKKRILQREDEEKRRRENQLKERRKADEEQRLRRQRQRKDEEERIRKEKEQKDLQQKRKQEQRIRTEKQKRQKQIRDAEERKRQEERIKKEKQQQERQQKEAEEKRKQEQKQKAERQKREREDREAEERNRRQAQRKEEERRKQQQRLRIQKQKKQKKAEQERIARQRQQKAKKQVEEKQRQQREKKERQEKERKQREERQKRERQQKQRKQRQRRENQERQKREREDRERKEKLQRQKRERQEKQKRQREQRERKQKEERERKQKEQREKRQRLQKQKREKQEKQRRQRQQKERIEKQKLERQRKLKEQRELQQKKQRQEQQRLRKEQQAKKNATKKPQTKKSSGINYGDFDDLVDDDLEQIQKNAKSKVSGPQDNEADEYIDDFDDQSPQKQGEIDQKDLISINDIKCLNDYMKGTTYARKNKPNAQLLNKGSLYLLLFEEFVQNKKLFFFEGAISKAILDLADEFVNPDANEDDLRMSVDTIKEQMMKMYADTLPEEQQMEMNSRYIFTFPFANDFHIKLIELIPSHCHFQIILEQALPDDEELHSRFEGIIEGLLYVFDLEGQPAMEDLVIGEQSKLVLGTFDKELPCLLLAFARHYQPTIPGQLLINQYTIERFFYTAHPIEAFYDAVKEGDQIIEFYNKLSEKYSANDKIKIFNIEVSSADEQLQEKLAHSALAIKEEFIKSKHQSFLCCFSIAIEDENGQAEERVAVYLSLDRASPKPAANYFIVSKDAAEQEHAILIFDCISAQGDQNFETTAYTDYTRHFCLSTYSDWTLPLWAHTTVKRKLSTLQAMRALTFAMTPYYLAFKEMD